MVTHKTFFQVVTHSESFTNYSFAWLQISDSITTHCFLWL